MKYLRRQNLNVGNILDDTILQTSDGNIELNPTQRVVINGNLIVEGGSIPSPEVTNVLYVTVDGNDANDGKGEGPNQAKRTIKSAVEAAQEGTTIFVRSGEYYEDNPIRIPPKVSIIGDNLRRTILRPLNGPKKFSATNVTVFNNEVTITTNIDHKFRLHDRVRVIIPEANIDVECANISEIVNSTQFKFREILPNLSLTTSTQGTVELGVDFFLVNSQSYIAQLVFKGFQAPGYCLNIDKDAIVDTSPYIQNCSNINGPWMRNGVEWLPFITEQPDLTGTMVKGPRPLRDDEIDPAQVHIYGINDRGAGGGMLIDGDRYNSESPIKSMVADAFTQVAQGAIGFHITNFGYMQLVSCFAVFCDKAFYTTKGGYLSISNSVIDFGNQGFVADGFYPVPYAKGVVTNPYYSRLGSVTVTTEGSAYSSVPNVTVQSPGIPGGVTATATANIDPIRGTVNAITVDDPGDGYTFQPTVTVDPPFTPYVLWQPNTAYTLGEYVVYESKEYQVSTGGISDPVIPPIHSSGTANNGTVGLTFVGQVATATGNLATNFIITVDGLSEKPQVGSMMFVNSDPVGYYIESTDNANLGFRYNEQKCRRDVAYITDAVLSDLIFGTNFRTIFAGRAYLRSYSSKVLSSQRAQTIAGLNQARDEVKARVSPANPTLESNIDALFAIVTNIIQTGDVGASVPNFTTLAGRPAGFLEAKNILLANKSFIQDQIVDYIANNLQGFQYDEVKCSRDVGIIVNSVIDDLVLGTNYLSKTAGLAYLRSYSSEVLENQKIPTVAGIERARDIVLKLLQDELDSEIKVKNLFNSIITIVREGKEIAAPETTYVDPVGVSSTIISAARAIETNKETIVQDVINYINANLTPTSIVNYNENTCRRDVKYILDALIFDILYTGNSATINVANSYFNASGILTIPTQIFEHVDAFGELKTLLSTFAPATATTTNSLLDIIINAVQSGQGTIPLLVSPTYTQGSFYQYYNDERTRIQSSVNDIKDEVIEYLNTTFAGNFTYVEATCRRDIDYIIDALAYDLNYGGNTQTTNAALAYSEGSVIAGEVEQTKQAYQYWKSILPYVLRNIAVPNAVLGQDTSLPLGNPSPEIYPSEIAQNLLQIVIDAIDYGPGHVPEPVTESEFSLGDASLIAFKNTVLDDIEDIKDVVTDFLNSAYGGNVDVRVFPGAIYIPANSVVSFHNVSTISTGGTALEYVGAGVTYNALPFFGGEPDPTQERIEINNGKCFTVTNDQVGNFRVGSLFEVNALTGGVTIDANNLSLGGIASIGPFKRNGITVGVELKEVSNNPALISSIGTQDVNTVPTQQAVSVYVENRYLNKVQSTTPQTVESDVAFQRDVAIEGGDLTTTQTTFNLLNQNATTVNAFGDVSTLNIGNATSATTTLRPGTLVGVNTTQNVYNSVATTVNFAGAASTINIGANSGTLTIGNPIVVGTLPTQNIYNTVATTVNAFGAASTINMGANGGTLTIGNPTVVGTQATQSIYNTVATTVNAFGAASTINMGANSGTLTIGNPTVVGTQTTQNLYNTIATTVNAFGDATSIVLGSITGTTNIKHNLDVDGNIEVGGNIIPTTDVSQDLGSPTNRFRDLYISGASIYLGNIVLSDSGVLQINSSMELTGNTFDTTSTTFNVINDTATTVNAFGAATTINIGAATGTLTLNNQQTVFNSTDSIQIPVGTTSQRDATPLAGQIRYNSELETFEGYGPGGQWGSLGGVKDVDGNTYIIAELSPAANDNTLWFYNDGVETLTITKNDVDFKDDVVITINNLTDTTNSTTGALKVLGGVMIAKDLFVGGGDIITDETTFNLLNATATTINFGGAATTLNIGANSGTLTISNPTVVGTETTQNLYNTVATTVNFAGSATAINIGEVTGLTRIRHSLQVDGNFNLGNDLIISGDLGVNGGDLTTTASTFNLLNATATTINFGGAATTIEIGSSSGTTNINNNLDVDGDVNIDGGDLTVSAATFNLANSNATTVNAFSAATTIEIGAATGTTNINHNLDVDGDVNIDGGDLTVSAAIFNLATTSATTVNFALAATDLQIGAATGTTNINNNLDVDGDVNIDGGDLTVSTPTFNLANTTATTVNAFGDATGINIGNATTATVTLRPGTLVGSNTTQNVYDTVATTVNFAGAATTLNVGNAISATITLRPGTLVGSNTTQNIYNTVATTVNAFGAATSVNIGDNTGTLTTRNPTIVGTQTTQNIYNSVATTVNAFGAATAINMGANSGTLTIGNPTVVGTQATQNLYNTVATTVNFAGAATTINIGAATGKTTIASVDNSTSSTTGALVVSGGIGIANDIVGAGFTTDPVTGATTEISSIKSFVIDEGEY